MSYFACETCGRTQVDKDGVGYVAGCSHYPPEGRFRDTFVTVWFGGDDETPTRAFYSGAWYKSDKAKAKGRAVHPVAWDAEHCHHGNITEDCERCIMMRKEARGIKPNPPRTHRFIKVKHPINN